MDPSCLRDWRRRDVADLLAVGSANVSVARRALEPIDKFRAAAAKRNGVGGPLTVRATRPRTMSRSPRMRPHPRPRCRSCRLADEGGHGRSSGPLQCSYAQTEVEGGGPKPMQIRSSETVPSFFFRGDHERGAEARSSACAGRGSAAGHAARGCAWSLLLLSAGCGGCGGSEHGSVQGATDSDGVITTGVEDGGGGIDETGMPPAPTTAFTTATTLAWSE